jgi:hypothetical protein
MMHLEPENHKTYYDQFIKLGAMVYAENAKGEDLTICTLISELIPLVAEHKFPAALRRLQKEIGRPGDRRAKAREAAAD